MSIKISTCNPVHKAQKIHSKSTNQSKQVPHTPIPKQTHNPSNRSPLTHTNQHLNSNQTFSPHTTSQLTEPKQTHEQRLDSEFVRILTELQSYYTLLTKHEQIRVEKWIVKIIQNDQTLRWKQNRNNYLRLLFHIVKNNGTLLEPFDKMPDLDKDLPYMSEHDYNQRTKPRFDGKALVFHVHKPEMIKITEPVGDCCSVLVSLVHTARTIKDKENQQSHRSEDKIKQSQLLEPQSGNSGRFYQINSKRSDTSFINQQSQVIEKHIFKKDKSGIQNQEECEQSPFQRKQDPSKDPIKSLELSSVIPSNLPSHVKTFQPVSKPSQERQQKYKNHQKYSNRNSVISSSHFGPNNLDSSNFNTQSRGNQVQIYKQLVLMMGKLLLKHEFAIQRESEYWHLMRIIYEYQKSIKTSGLNTPQVNRNRNYEDNSHERNYESCSNRFNNQSQIHEIQTFEKFLSRLRTEIQPHCEVSPHKTTQDPRQQSYSDCQSTPTYQQRSSFSPYGTRKQPTKKYQINEPMIHITEESLDFKVQQGLEPQHVLCYQLEQKPNQFSRNFPNQEPTSPNNYLSRQSMQISDTDRGRNQDQVEREINFNTRQAPEDYHNIFTELEEPIEEDGICFSDNDDIDQAYQHDQNDDGTTDRMYHRQDHYIEPADENVSVPYRNLQQQDKIQYESNYSQPQYEDEPHFRQ